MKHWTPAEEEELRRIAPFLTRMEIAERLGLSYEAVNGKVRLMHLVTKPAKVGRKRKSKEHLKEMQKKKHARYYERHKEERRAYQRKYYFELKEDEEAYGEYLQKAKERRCLTITKAIHG